VLCRRMHPNGGAEVELPQVGELGVVAILPNGLSVWLGSLPYQNENQVDPTEGIFYHRHASGTTIQIRPNGDYQVSHPSGARLTLAQEDGPIGDPQASSRRDVAGNTSPPKLAATGFVDVTLHGNGEGKLDVSGFDSVQFQGGSHRFVMDGLLDAFNNHTHGNGNNGSPTTAPNAPLQADSVCSPAKFQGPQGA
jgi:hypothetical protein